MFLFMVSLAIPFNVVSVNVCFFLIVIIYESLKQPVDDYIVVVQEIGLMEI